ncbi:hypothetical protein JAAARDRAFT_76071 [Jaapia argillacea MUCL 33604]|uniref:Large ribosomal subunit protein uL5 C-terminal domain-containing protein n=1 Tax=Jaapia argillacea MUCL 33604 TaxID=933084 RepID=A0A067QEV6_9AGAM|nr:hypothetical protein JAAARDRAFT_76071 [Jaapia argillacea MUCL 33604]
MSAAASALTRTRPTTLTKSIRPTRRPPRIRKGLPRDARGLPIPHVSFTIRDTHPCRLLDHYHTTLQEDVMYMTYTHTSSLNPPKPPKEIRKKFDPLNPYAVFRSNPPVGGDMIGRKPAPECSPENTVQLERIQLHSMIKDAISNRQNLLGPIMAFRAISGETQFGAGRHTAEGVQIIKGRQTVQNWIRPGIPVGVKVDIRGPKMYELLGVLAEFVFPRLREFHGFLMPPASAPLNTPAGVAGVVSVGIPPEAMGFFPQIEVNLDAYPKSYGMHIHFITNATGQGAQNKARALMSGYQIPFLRR